MEALPVIRFENETGDNKFLSQHIPLPVQADISLPVNTAALEQLLNQLPTGLPVNIDALRPATGGEPRYVAVGGSLTAGWRDGGLYRAGQLTAYPNLIAKQMGLRNFQQPLFSIEQGNGTGYKQWVSGTTQPRFVEVVNNRSIVSTSPLTLTPYTGAVNNLGMPYLGESTIYQTDNWRLDPNLAPGNYEPAYRTYFRRLLPTDNLQWTTYYREYFQQQPADLCTIELGVDDMIGYAYSGGTAFNAVRGMDIATGRAFRALLYDLHARGEGKCVIATVPDVRQFPYFKLYTVAEARRRNGGKPLYVRGLTSGSARPVDEGDFLLPSTRVEALFSAETGDKAGLSASNPLLNRDVLSDDELEDLTAYIAYNQIIDFSSKEWATSNFKINIVDIAALYERILKGEYVTQDGVRIDPSFPNGNFFSQDGLYPTALGQAAIANEWIKVINQAYGTNVPLIATRQFVGIK